MLQLHLPRRPRGVSSSVPKCQQTISLIIEQLPQHASHLLSFFEAAKQLTIPNLVVSPAHKVSHTSHTQDSKPATDLLHDSKARRKKSRHLLNHARRYIQAHKKMHITSPIAFSIIFSVSHTAYLPGLHKSRGLKSSHTDADVNQVVVTSIIIAITAMLVCMCYMVNARRKLKQIEDVSWEMQVHGVGSDAEMEERNVRSQKGDDVKG